MALSSKIVLVQASDLPLYRQIADSFGSLIKSGSIAAGERLPATRELAGQLGLNRATISAAYALLEEAGLIQGHVGRGSFVAVRSTPAKTPETLNWNSVFTGACRDASTAGNAPATPTVVNFASSRPDQVAFPLPIFRKLAREVVDSAEASDILQLGSSYGYGPLRRFLLDEAVAEGTARPSDAVLMTNGCQQALDLLARLFSSGLHNANAKGNASAGGGTGVVVEDPCYHGLLRVFARTGLPLYPVPVGKNGMDLDSLEETLVRHRPRLLIVTPSFHNPTGATLPLAARKRMLELVKAYGLVLVESDIYSQLRYTGTAVPSLKQLDGSGNTILLRSYSKVAFPGLRVGWVIAPREVIARLADEKQVADLHSDQLSQAVLLRFAQSGELARHLDRTRTDGAERLQVALQACKRFLPVGSHWTRPEGGMSLWVELPSPLFAEPVLLRAQKRGVDFLSGHHFASRPAHARALRISFGGLSPASIQLGLQIVGEAAAAELAAIQERIHAEPGVALV